MANTTYITIDTLCTHYEVETVFIDHLHEVGLITIHIHNKCKCLPQVELQQFEKIIRLHRELELNPAGIDVVLNLLNRLETQQKQISRLKNQLLRFDENV